MTEPAEQKDVTDLIGEFGPWQRNIFIIVFLIGLPAAWNNLLITLVAPPVDHWCAKPTSLRNVTEEEWKSIALPVVSTAAQPQHYSKCEMYEEYDRLNETSLLEYVHDSNNRSKSNSTAIPCRSFEFDHAQFNSTIVEEPESKQYHNARIEFLDHGTSQDKTCAFFTVLYLDYYDSAAFFLYISFFLLLSLFTFTTLSLRHNREFYPWELVCNRAWLVSTSQSIYMVGYLVAVVFLGQISDRFGRRPVMLLSIVVLLVSGIICAFSPTFIVFCVCRFFIAVGRAGLYVTAFVLLMETVGPKYRPVLGLAREFGWATGYVTLPGIAWLIRKWDFIQLAISLPVAGFLFMWCLIPESPRWLLTQLRIEEAEKLVTEAAKKNGREISGVSDILRRLASAPESKEKEKKVHRSTALDLLKTPNMKIRTMIICFNWFVNAFIFYGLSLNTGNVGGDVFLNVFIAGAVEFPAYFLFIFITKAFGRRIPLLVTMVIGGLSCILTIPVPQDLVWVRMTLASFGKFCITASYVIVYVFSAEIYPTSVRNVGVGISATFARIGSVVAPFVKELGQYTHRSVPLGLFGLLSMVGGLLVLLLPETNNKTLPDTLEQGEMFGKKETEKTKQKSSKSAVECIDMKPLDTEPRKNM